MNANVNKSNTGKLLVAVLAMAMIIAGCAIVFSDSASAESTGTSSDPYDLGGPVTVYDDMDAYNADTEGTKTPTTLAAAFENQSADQVWVLKSGAYYNVIGANDSNTKYTGSKFLITADNITVIGNGATIFSDYANNQMNSPVVDGKYNASATVSILGDGVTISNMTVQVMVQYSTGTQYEFYANKSIVVSGANATIENVTTAPNTLGTFPKTLEDGTTAVVDPTFTNSGYGGLFFTEKSGDSTPSVEVSGMTLVNGRITTGYSNDNSSTMTLSNTTLIINEKGVGTNAGLSDMSQVTVTDGSKFTVQIDASITDVYDKSTDPATYITGISKILNNAPAGTTVEINAPVSLAEETTIPTGVSAIIGAEGSIDTNGKKLINNGTIESSSAQDGSNTGLQGQLNFNLELSTSEYLSGDYVISEGYTLTLHSGGQLALNGYQLIVYGTLVVENGASITGLGIDNTTSDRGEGIYLAPNGAIDNTGVIGKGANAVKVSAYAPASTGTTTITADGSVEIQNVTGISFSLDRTVNIAANTIAYTLAFSGNAVRNGSVEPYAITADGAVINGDLTIGNSVQFSTTGQNVTVKNNAAVTVNGQIGGTVVLTNGTSITLNGTTVDAGVDIQAASGTYVSSDTASALVDYTSVKVVNTRGITIEVVSESYMDQDTEINMTEQRILLSGTAAKANTAEGAVNASVTIDAGTSGIEANTVTSYIGVYVDGEFYIPTKTNPVSFTVNSGMVTVNGQISSDGEIIKSGAESRFTGTAYDVGTTDMVYYVTGFEQALANIASANAQTIYVYGDLTIDGQVVLTTGQNISLDNAGEVVIDENGSVEVQDGASIDGIVDDVQGVMTVIYGGSAAEPDNYAVKTTNANNDVTYSGLAYALNNAAEGDTVNLVGDDVQVDGSLTVPAGITLDINQGAKLTVTRNLTVNGTVLNHGELSVGRNTTVSGTIDNTEGTMALATGNTTDTPYDVDVSGTGSIVFNGSVTEFAGTYNGSYYYDADENTTVFTTLSNAANAVAEKDIVPAITVIGDYSENTTVNSSGNITIAQGATVSVGEIVLDDCTLYIVGTFSGSVTGQSGEDGSTVASTVDLSRASGVSVANSSKPNNANVTVWSTTVAPYAPVGQTTTDFGSETETMTVSAGTITLGDMTINASGENPSVTVASGATVVIPGEITSNGMTVNGAIIVEGTFTAASNTLIAGTMDIALEGAVKVTAMTVTGTVNVASQEDQEPGKLTVNGTLTIGEKPELLGAVTTGAVVGKIDFGTSGTPAVNGYVKAYSGADMSGAVFDENEGVSTAYYINDVLYMTVYTVDNSGWAIANLGSNSTESYTMAGLETGSVTYKDSEGNGLSTGAVIGSVDSVYATVKVSDIGGVISVGTGLTMYIDGLTIQNFVKEVGDFNFALSVGTHVISIAANNGYDATNATITFNGATVSNGGSIEVTADMIQDGFVLAASGAVPATVPSGGSSSSDDGMGLTDYLLIILVVLIVIMAIMVAMRLMRS